MAFVRISLEVTRWTVVAITLTLAVDVQVHGTGDALSDRDAVDGEVHAAGSAFDVWERHAARFVVLAGGVVGQVAELVRRSDKAVDHEWVAGFRLQA